MSSPSLVYPLELKSLPTRPTIRFMKDGGSGTGGLSSVSMPAPNSIAFADSASYNNAELGAKGSLAAQGAKTANEGKPISAMWGAIKSAVGGVFDMGVGGAAQALTANSSAGEGVKSGVSIGVGATLNKNITTEFTGVGTREFSFAFKFISCSASETKEVNNIFRLFRSGLYPKGELYQLKYPPKWQIKFMVGVSEIEHIPKIFECYLKDMTSTYNAGSNSWRVDGSPLESDLTLTFVETRALTLEDIEKLEGGFDSAKFAKRYNNTNEAADPAPGAPPAAEAGVPVSNSTATSATQTKTS